MEQVLGIKHYTFRVRLLFPAGNTLELAVHARDMLHAEQIICEALMDEGIATDGVRVCLLRKH